MPDPFISRDDLTDYLGRDVTGDDGALIAVDAACDTVRTIAEQDFNPPPAPSRSTGRARTRCCCRSCRSTRPARSWCRGGTVTDYVLNGNGVLIRKLADPTVIDWDTDISPPLIRWPAGRQNVVVTYDHGYADADLPRDVRMVALSLGLAADCAGRGGEGAGWGQHDGLRRPRHGFDGGGAGDPEEVQALMGQSTFMNGGAATQLRGLQWLALSERRVHRRRLPDRRRGRRRRAPRCGRTGRRCRAGSTR